MYILLHFQMVIWSQLKASAEGLCDILIYAQLKWTQTNPKKKNMPSEVSCD